MEIQWQTKMYVGISMISTFPRTLVGTILRRHGTYMEIYSAYMEISLYQSVGARCVRSALG